MYCLRRTSVYCQLPQYTDGNLVASLLCSRLGVTQANIAHALEMSKYRDANMNW